MSPGVCSISKTKPRISSYWNFMQIEIIVVTSKNVFFNESLFANFETTIGFILSKWIRRWSQILIRSPGWPCTQKWDKTFNCQFIDYLEKRNFFETTSNIDMVYAIGNHFLPWVWIWNCHLKMSSVWFESTGKVYHFCMEKCTDDPGTFIVNGGYRVEGEIKLSKMVPSATIKMVGAFRFTVVKLRLQSRATHWRNDDDPHGGELSLEASTSSECAGTAGVELRQPENLDRRRPYVEERESEIVR